MDQAQTAMDRLALPAGDPISWTVLVAGTLLDGVRWPGFGTRGWDCPIGGSSELPR